MAYMVFPDVNDRRKDLLIDECDANMLDIIFCVINVKERLILRSPSCWPGV